MCNFSTGKIFLLILLISNFTISQTLNFGISKRDLEITSCPIDSSANAYYMLERGESSIETGGAFNLIHEYEAKVKIINSEGFKHASVEIILFNNGKLFEKLVSISARTHYLENGKAENLKVEKDQIFTEKIDENYTRINFTFPKVSEGCVLHYRYKIRSPFKFNFTNWRFQESIPKLYSQFQSNIPAVYRYRTKLMGLVELKSHTSRLERNCINYQQIKADCAIDTYIMENIPAFRSEDYMLSKENYIAQIEYELESIDWIDGRTDYTKNWKDVDKEIRTAYSIGRESKKENFFKKNLPETITDQQYGLDKAKNIYYYFLKKLQWNENHTIFRDFDVKKSYQNKGGNLAEIHTVLLNALKSQGFKANTLLLSTRENGLVTKLFPVISEFNYALVKLDFEGESYLLDLTNKFQKFGNFPFKCLNKYGRVIDFEKGSYWYDIKSKENRMVNKELNYSMNEEIISGKAKIKTKGISTNTKRNNLYFKDKYISFLEDDNQISISSLSSENHENLEEELIEIIDFEIETELVGNAIYFNPFLFSEFKINPFNLKERNYPVDFGVKHYYNTQIRFEIPKNYTAVIDFKNQIIKTDDNSVIISYDLKEENEQIIITERIQVLNTIVKAHHYDRLKEIFNSIIENRANANIVLKRNN